MSKEEAIEELKMHKEVMEVTLCMQASRKKDYKYPKVLEALDCAIEELSKDM